MSKSYANETTALFLPGNREPAAAFYGCRPRKKAKITAQTRSNPMANAQSGESATHRLVSHISAGAQHTDALFPSA
jgi:hypothetical protein